MTRVHEELQSVLRQLEHMDAGIVKFNPFDLSEFEAERWLRSERSRLTKLQGAVSDLMLSTPTPPCEQGNPQVVGLPSHRRRGARSK